MSLETTNTALENVRRSIPSVEERIRALRERTVGEIAEARTRVFAGSPAPRPLPPGKTLEAVIVGSLPDEQSEADIRAALAELS